VLLPFALRHPALSLLYLTVLVLGLARAGRMLSRRQVRRALDALTGAALVAFGTRPAAEH